jgi:hypothetical protein
VNYLRHPLLALWLLITAALVVSVLALATAQAPRALSPRPPANVTAAVTALRMDFAALGPDATYGGLQYVLLLNRIASDATRDVGRVPASFAAPFRSIAATARRGARYARTDKVAARWTYVVALTTYIDRMTVLDAFH